VGSSDANVGVHTCSPSHTVCENDGNRSNSFIDRDPLVPRAKRGRDASREMGGDQFAGGRELMAGCVSGLGGS